MSVEAAAAFLKAHDSFVITAHINPDGDALGSMLAMGSVLQALEKKYRIISNNLPTDTYDFLPDIGLVEQYNPLTEYHFEAAIILDIGEWDRMGSVTGCINATQLAILNVDHHQSNNLFGDVAYVNPRACSASIMVFNIVKELGIYISSALATQMYTGILTDTGGFHFSNTDGDVLRTCGELIDCGADPTTIMSKVYHEKTALSVVVTEKVLSTLEFYSHNHIVCVVLDNTIISRIKGHSREDIIANTEGIIDYIRSIRGVWMAIFFREEADGIKVSLRSTREGIDVNALAGQYGGGGHIKASGAHIKQPLPIAKPHFIAAAVALVEKALTIHE